MWLYTNTPDNKARFVLGEPGENNLICFGINPSTAVPNDLDPTLARVKKIAELKGFDGWIMLNVYPQRATNPDDMDAKMNVNYHRLNLQHIDTILAQYSGIIWAAWGTLIDKRSYLKACLNDIVIQSWPHNADWRTRGKKSRAGHPHHPLYLKHSLGLDTFDIEGYLNQYNL